MDKLLELREYGVSLGYKEEELRQFVREQQVIQREERLAARQKEKEEREYNLEIEKAQLEKERLVQEIKLQEITHMQKIEMLEKQSLLSPRSEVSFSDNTSAPRAPKIPYFEDGKDDMDSYLRRFERYAISQKWKNSELATNLSALLRGKALDVYALMPADKALDYEALKDALLKRYDLTEDGFKRKFRSCRPEIGETFVQFSVRLNSYFKRWIEMSKTKMTFDGLFDLMLRDQFMHVCSKDLLLFLKERIPSSLDKMASLADQYREARFISASALLNKSKTVQSSNNSSNYRHPDKPQKEQLSKSVERTPFVPVSDRKCFKCGKQGHIASDCRVKSNTNKVSTVTADMRTSRGNSKFYGKESEDLNRTNVCNACTVPYQSFVNAFPSTDTTLSSSCQSMSAVSMPVSPGLVNGKPVTVLRDTGCSGIVVKRSVVDEDCLLGSIQVCLLADGSKIEAPVAHIFIDTPYLKGEYDAWCMATPVYDLIIGNVPNAKEPGNPNPNWRSVNAVETRQQVKDKGKPYSQLRVQDIITSEVNPKEIVEAQQNDPTLAKVRTLVQSGNTIAHHNGKVKWVEKKKLMYREFMSTSVENGKVYCQLVVPESYRERVMKLAHESIMSGHMGTQRTLDRILTSFYWPGITSDVKRFCQSCDICQKTVPKGRIGRVPLQKMPLIDEPFKRVAVDLIGPLHPITDRGNRYILTLVDYATRYPEAIALKGIETERVAEALVDIFCRVGVPQEMLTDMGSQFTSALMNEVCRLISLKQLTTTVYHPMCNGLVERFNGSLKQMLKRMCTERPKDWDRYLNALLFAYREVPQESLKFSPFELIYGRSVRGPLSILKELWTKEPIDTEVKTTYQYVIDLKERLESTCDLARNNLEKASKKHRIYYDRSAKERNMMVGDRVLILLPTDNNKLLMQWKGPFDVVGKVGQVDYKVSVNGKIKTFHANLLKKYLDRTNICDSSTVHDDQNNEVLATINMAVIDMDSEENDAQGEFHDIPCINPDAGPDQVDVNPELKEEEKTKVRELLNDFPDVFSDKPGCTDLLEHEIRLSTDIPIRIKPYPIPYSLISTVNDEVTKMLELNVIEPSSSPYCFPIVIVKKKDSTNRFCIDFRTLNSQTIFDAEPMPNADEMFSKLAGHKFFSRLDLSKGYWQLPLAECSRPKTAFQTPKGLYHFCRMPFGLVTAPASFSRLMRLVLKDMENIDNFIDDIIIFTMTFVEHLNVLRELLIRLRNAHLTAKPGKCSIAYDSLECLGHFVGDDKLKPHPDKVRAIEEAPRPITKKQVRSFLGLVGFYRKFIPNFACIAVPLTDLTKKGQPNKVIWERSHEHAFGTLRNALIKFPILKLPNMSEPFILMTDASDYGIGAVLMQEQEGIKMPVSYASRKLKSSEVAYSTIEKECLAIVWAIQKFHRYLYGQEFTLQTDHKPLIYLNKKKVANARLMRWALVLQPYKFKIVAVSGKANVGADYLSRI